MNRRHFLHSSLAAAASLPTSGAAPGAKPEICIFTKPLQSLAPAELARFVKEMGFDGVEAPIRPKGHIEPAEVPDKLPAFVEALHEEGLKMTVLASGINEVSKEQHTEAVLRTAAALGVKRYRTSYFKYDLDKPIRPQLADFRAKLVDLAALNAELGIQAVYQNHSGKNYLGGGIWDLDVVLEGIDPAHLGVAYDIGHATVEGGESWPTHARLIRDHVGVVYAKAFDWEKGKRVKRALGDGRVTSEYFRYLKKTGYEGPYSLHVEYLDHKDPDLLAKARAAMTRDLAQLQEWIG